jgi:ornithine decarboxylase
MSKTYPSVEAFLAETDPDRPVHCFRPHLMARAADHFIQGFPGDVLFAVKANAHPTVLQTLWRSGIRHFDVASEHEIKTVRDLLPDAQLYFHHPAKTPRLIAWAYHDMGIRYFAVDCEAELAKVAAHAGPGSVAMVRLSAPQGMAVYDLSTKFGASPEQVVTLLRLAPKLGLEAGLTFHVGSQCLRPEAYPTAIALAVRTIDEAGVPVRWMDLGGGFPAYYRTTEAPPLEMFFAQIRAAEETLCRPRGIRLLCEPGRAMVAEGGSLLTRVVLRKGDDVLHLNDGIFGGFAEVAWGKDELSLPFRVHRPGRTSDASSRSFTLYGPTCDGNDRLPYLVDLPHDIADGDWIEFNLLGAYGREMAGHYNGLTSDAVALFEDSFVADDIPPPK